MDPDWDQLFGSPENSSLRAFFFRHPDLRTIGIGCVPKEAYDKPIDPEDVAALFPGVTHFAAPSFLCGPIMVSTLARQITSISITHSLFDRAPFEPSQSTPSQQTLKTTNLKRLSVGSMESDAVSANVLQKIVRCTPGLEELEITFMVAEPVCITDSNTKHELRLKHSFKNELLDILATLPNLRVLIVTTFTVRRIQLQFGLDGWTNYIGGFAGACPLLRSVGEIGAYEHKFYWGIDRENRTLVVPVEYRGWL
ncbi:hypothetical protein FRC08_013490 [Ceratobasidium sp. 394]|nr:hypothetical protein FRC08_013490 [Ceratobasidium sp. 394]